VSFPPGAATQIVRVLTQLTLPHTRFARLHPGGRSPVSTDTAGKVDAACLARDAYLYIRQSTSGGSRTPPWTYP